MRFCGYILARMKAIPFGRALYYPHIFPQDRRWLRTAALFHDGLSRIVPRSFVPGHYRRASSPETERDFEALAECGFIEDEWPDYVLDEVGGKFLDFIAPNLENRDRKSRLVSGLKSAQWRPYTMHRQKINASLLSLLEEQGLATWVNKDEISFQDQVGGLYMLFLARHMAKSRPIVTDNPLFEALSYGPPESRSFSMESTDPGLVLATAIFRTAVPMDVESVEIHDLIRFRMDFAAERLAFYDAIEKMAADLIALQDQRLLRQAVEHHSASIENKIASLEKKLGLLKMTCGRGIFSLSLPAWTTGAAWGLGVTNPATLMAVGSFVVTGMLLSSRFEQQLAKADSTVSYIHSLRNYLTPKAYAEEFVSLNLTGRQRQSRPGFLDRLRQAWKR
jgi:hypothetical protein